MSDHVPVAQFESDFEREMQRKYSDKLDKNHKSKFWNKHNWLFEAHAYYSAIEWLEICHNRQYSWFRWSIQENKMDWIEYRIAGSGIHIHNVKSFWESPEGKEIYKEYFRVHYVSSPHYNNPEAKWIAKIAMEYFKITFYKTFFKIIFSNLYVNSKCPDCRAAAQP